MEKLLQPYDKEYMKMAMLKHEETFKHQVYELHRLYRIQKILMKSIKHSRPNSRENQERWVSRGGIKLNQIDDDDNHHHHQARPGLDLEQLAAEEYINYVESDGEVALAIEDESEIQLTLGPASYYRRKKAEAPPPPPPNSEYSGPASFSSSSPGSSSRMKRMTTSGIHQGTNIISREELTCGHKCRSLAMLPDSNTGLRGGRIKISFDVEEQLIISQDRLKQPPWLFQHLNLNMA